MKLRFTKLIIVLFATVFMSGTYAADGKIAVVDFGRAIFSSNVAKARMEQLKQESSFAALQASIDSTAADLQALQKEAETKSMTMSQEQAAELQKKAEYIKADRDLALRKLKAESQALQNSILKELQPKASEALKELLKEEKVALLLSAEAVMVAAPELDLTAKLTDRINQKTK